MSTCYCAFVDAAADKLSFANIKATDLFGGRLEAFGVHEHFHKETSEGQRVLTDGHNYLWVTVAGGVVKGFVRYMPNGAPGTILGAIEDAFDVDIVSEHAPKFWGFDTQEEWDAAMLALAGRDMIREKFIAEDPALQLPKNETTLDDAIEAYIRDHGVTFTFGPEPEYEVLMEMANPPKG